MIGAFDDAGPPDPQRDIENVELELILSDLAVVEKRLERLEKDLKKQKTPALQKELNVLQASKAALEKQTPLREVARDAEEERLIRGFTFLSSKPMLYVLNLGESEPGSWLRAAVAVLWPRAKVAKITALRGDASTRRFWPATRTAGLR